MKNEFYNKYLRPIALSVVFSVIGQVFVLFFTKLMGLELSKVLRSIIVFVVTSAAVLIFFPKGLGIPFGKVHLKEWFRRLGVYLPEHLSKHVLLGILLGCVSLTGMLLGSVFTGKYVPDLNNISPGHLLFSLTPAIWEEILFRGVIMILLIQYTQNLQKAFWWQILIFALCHVKGFGITDLVEIISVAFIGFTMTLSAVKTKSLIAGIIYHYLHDAFLYFVQIPGGIYHGFVDNITFYSFLWTALLINIFIVLLFSERFKTQGQNRFYCINGLSDFDVFKFTPGPSNPKQEKIERALFLLYVFTAFASLTERFSAALNAAFFLILFALILNLLAWIFYKTLGKKMVILTFLINGICNIISGYDAFLHGSRRAYIITILVGFVYLIIGVFIWALKANTDVKRESV